LFSAYRIAILAPKASTLAVDGKFKNASGHRSSVAGSTLEYGLDNHKITSVLDTALRRLGQFIGVGKSRRLFQFSMASKVLGMNIPAESLQELRRICAEMLPYHLTEAEILQIAQRVVRYLMHLTSQDSDNSNRFDVF
jgi:hypothetical protein